MKRSFRAVWKADSGTRRNAVVLRLKSRSDHLGLALFANLTMTQTRNLKIGKQLPIASWTTSSLKLFEWSTRKKKIKQVFTKETVVLRCEGLLAE